MLHGLKLLERSTRFQSSHMLDPTFTIKSKVIINNQDITIFYLKA